MDSILGLFLTPRGLHELLVVSLISQMSTRYVVRHNVFYYKISSSAALGLYNHLAFPMNSFPIRIAHKL
jgi:hypothetical protein